MDPSERIRRLQKAHEQKSTEKYAEEQMDFWPEDKRAAPNAMVRCALFRGAMANRGGKREMHRETLLASLGGEEIYYTGEDLDQRDMDVWMAVLQLFREQPVGQYVHVTSNRLLRLAGLTNTGPSHDALEERLKRLALGRVDLIPTDPKSRAVFFGSLLQSAERTPDGKYWELSLAPRLKALFNEGYTWVDWSIRNELRRASLAQWLHSFYRSHREPMPIGVEKLKDLSGSGTKELRYFRSDLKKALKRLEKACDKYGVKLDWNHDRRSDRVEVQWITRETQKQITT